MRRLWIQEWSVRGIPTHLFCRPSANRAPVTLWARSQTSIPKVSKHYNRWWKDTRCIFAQSQESAAIYFRCAYVKCRRHSRSCRKCDWTWLGRLRGTSLLGRRTLDTTRQSWWLSNLLAASSRNGDSQERSWCSIKDNRRIVTFMDRSNDLQICDVLSLLDRREIQISFLCRMYWLL